MFVKYSKGTYGVVDYLKLGVSKDRDFSRDEMDIRQVLHGNIEELDIILNKYNKPYAKGDNYKHFVITFEDINTLNSDIKNITNEFKEFSMSGYKDDELYFYAEAHIPKLKGYPFMSGEYNSRKPHVHVIIPVFNLYTGNKGYNFNINTFNYRKYLDLFSKKMNYKYNLNSPFEPENKKLFKTKSDQIFRKTGSIYKNKDFLIKEKVLELIISKNIKNHKELGNIIKLYINNIEDVVIGDLNKEILILKFNYLAQNKKEIALRDYCFSKEFLLLPKEKQVYAFEKYKNNQNLTKEENNIYNTKLTILEENDLKTYFQIISKLLKYSKIKPKIVENIKYKSNKIQFNTLNQLEKDFYERNRHGQLGILESIKTYIRTAIFDCKRIKSNSITKQSNFKLLSGGKRNDKRRLISIYDLNIDHNTLNKILEIKYGSSPNRQFIQNYNTLNLQQKSELYLFVGLNIKKLKTIKFPNYKIISNFYNGDLNKKLIDNYKIWLKINKNKIKNPVLGIVDEKYWNNISDNILVKENLNNRLKEFNSLKNKIEEKYLNQSKIKRIHLKNLKNEFSDIFKIKKQTMSKNIKENLQLTKPSLRNNTIVNDSYLQFLNHCILNKILIPEENIKDIRTYLILVDLCKNKNTKDNEEIKHDIIKQKQIHNNEEVIDNLNILVDVVDSLEIEYYDKFINEIQTIVLEQEFKQSKEEIVVEVDKNNLEII